MRNEEERVKTQARNECRQRARGMFSGSDRRRRGTGLVSRQLTRRGAAFPSAALPEKRFADRGRSSFRGGTPRGR